jgi:oligosaccharide repeat unit polymerase
MYYKVSKLNKSYINSYTIKFATSVILQIVPFMLYNSRSNLVGGFSSEVINLFILSLLTYSFAEFFGYLLGHKKKLKFNFMKMDMSRLATNLVIVFSFLIAVISFIFMGIKGVGILTWILDNRHAYIVGRKGVGVYYMLYELMILMFFVGVLTKKNGGRKKIIGTLITLFLSFFTGSKGFLLGILLGYLLYYDLYIKKIRIKKIVPLAFVFIIMINMLLLVQSNLNILEYGGNDFYMNYFRLLDRYSSNQIDYYFGRLTLENNLWFLIPRSIFPNKPFIYGQTRLVEMFYGSDVVIMGHTPSFTPMGVPFADGGLIAIFVIFLIKGMITGVIENTLRRNLNNNTPSYVPMFMYVALFFASVVNLSNLYFVVLLVILVLYIRLFYKKKRILVL